MIKVLFPDPTGNSLRAGPVSGFAYCYISNTACSAPHKESHWGWKCECRKKEEKGDGQEGPREEETGFPRPCSIAEMRQAHEWDLWPHWFLLQCHSHLTDCLLHSGFKHTCIYFGSLFAEDVSHQLNTMLWAMPGGYQLTLGSVSCNQKIIPIL